MFLFILLQFIYYLSPLLYLLCSLCFSTHACLLQVQTHWHTYEVKTTYLYLFGNFNRRINCCFMFCRWNSSSKNTWFIEKVHSHKAEISKVSMFSWAHENIDILEIQSFQRTWTHTHKHTPISLSKPIFCACSFISWFFWTSSRRFKEAVAVETKPYLPLSLGCTSMTSDFLWVNHTHLLYTPHSDRTCLTWEVTGLTHTQSNHRVSVCARICVCVFTSAAQIV